MSTSPFRGLLITAFALALCIVVLQWFFPGLVYEHIWILYAFLLLVSAGSAAILTNIIRKYPSIFLNSYMGIMVGRLFLLAAFAGIFVYIDRDGAMRFTASFIILYLFFHGFEIKGILTNLRHQNKKGNRDDQTP